MAPEKSLWDTGAWLPVVVPLAACYRLWRKNRDDTFWKCVGAMYQEPLRRQGVEPQEAADDLRDLAQSGHLLLLLDGADEVQGAPSEFWRMIEQALETAGNCRVLTTSRPEWAHPPIEGLREATLMPFSRDLQEGLLTAWFSEDGERGRQLLRETEAHPRLSSLVSNPLLGTQETTVKQLSREASWPGVVAGRTSRGRPSQPY